MPRTTDKLEQNKEARENAVNLAFADVENSDYDPKDFNDLSDEIKDLSSLSPEEELPYRVQRFCQEYVVHYDGEKAAKNAGWPMWNAYAASNRLLADEKVKKEIERLQKKIAVNLQITAEAVLSNYAKMAHANIMDFVDSDGCFLGWDKIDRDKAYNIESVKFGSKIIKDSDGNDKVVPYIKDFKLLSKKAGNDALANHLGLFNTDKDNKEMSMDLKTLISMFPKNVQDAIKVELAKRINNK